MVGDTGSGFTINVETTWFPQGIAGRWLGKPIIELIEASEQKTKKVMREGKW